MEETEVKKAIREGYARVVSQSGPCCCGGGAGKALSLSQQIGYSGDELEDVPEGANLGLGCGNPVALAGLKKGEVVLDLGSGAGLDCFLAARKVGAKGRVIGVDMTPEMIDRGRNNARKGNYKNVEFRLGEIENLPVADSAVDIIISNCVINLAPDKKRVFAEAFRVLKPGGRLMVSDIVLLQELPAVIKDSVEAYIGCVAGAMMKEQYLKTIKNAGFRQVKVVEEVSFPIELMAEDAAAQAILENLKMPMEAVKSIIQSVTSLRVQGVKPETTAQ